CPRAKQATPRSKHRPTAQYPPSKYPLVICDSCVGCNSVSLLLRHFIPAPTKQCQALLGVASVFSFAWATLGRLGWTGQSYGGNSVIERLDDRIFKFLYSLAMFVGTLAL